MKNKITTNITKQVDKFIAEFPRKTEVYICKKLYKLFKLEEWAYTYSYKYVFNLIKGRYMPVRLQYGELAKKLDEYSYYKRFYLHINRAFIHNFNTSKIVDTPKIVEGIVNQQKQFHLSEVNAEIGDILSKYTKKGNKKELMEEIRNYFVTTSQSIEVSEEFAKEAQKRVEGISHGAS